MTCRSYGELVLDMVFHSLPGILRAKQIISKATLTFSPLHQHPRSLPRISCPSRLLLTGFHSFNEIVWGTQRFTSTWFDFDRILSDSFCLQNGFISDPPAFLICPLCLDPYKDPSVVSSYEAYTLPAFV